MSYRDHILGKLGLGSGRPPITTSGLAQAALMLLLTEKDFERIWKATYALHRDMHGLGEPPPMSFRLAAFSLMRDIGARRMSHIAHLLPRDDRLDFRMEAKP